MPKSHAFNRSGLSSRRSPRYIAIPDDPANIVQNPPVVALGKAHECVIVAKLCPDHVHLFADLLEAWHLRPPTLYVTGEAGKFKCDRFAQ